MGTSALSSVSPFLPFRFAFMWHRIDLGQGQVSLAIAFFFASFGIESTLGRGRLVSPLPSFIFCNFLGIASILCRGSCGLAACPCEEHSDYVPDAICSAVLTTPSELRLRV